jgi:hypothetical protein
MVPNSDNRDKTVVADICLDDCIICILQQSTTITSSLPPTYHAARKKLSKNIGLGSFHIWLRALTEGHSPASIGRAGEPVAPDKADGAVGSSKPVVPGVSSGNRWG